MFMSNWQDRYGQWEGTAAELADVAEQLERVMFPTTTQEGNAPNLRLVRNYVTLGVLSRAERRGKEAIFGFRQLVEFLAARVLVREGWPLPKIAELVCAAPDDRLLELLPALKVTKAQQLVAAFRGGRSDAPRLPSSSTPISGPVFDSAKLRGDLMSLGNAVGAPAISHSITVELAPWCRLVVDSAALRRLDDDAMDRLAYAVRKSLARAKLIKGEGR